MFDPKTSIPDSPKVVGLVGKLCPKTDGMIVHATCFGARVAPRTKGVNVGESIADQMAIQVARVNAMHPPVETV